MTATRAPGGAAGAPAFSPDELRRYARHLILPGVGAAGQARLREARVLLIGAGGLGSPAALYLAAAGVGTIGLVDFDAVEVSNLQRQIVHGTSQVGRPKTDSAADRLRDLNPHVAVETFDTRLTSANALDILGRFDVIVDGSDNFPTRYLVNDACVLLGKPCVYGAIFRFDGQVSVFGAKDGPCYRCLYADPPPPELVPSCAEGGVLGVLPGIVGSLQALEAIKLVLGAGTPLVGRLLLFDALRLTFREVEVRRDPACPACGEHPSIRALIDYEEFCGVRTAPAGAEVEPAAVAAALGAGRRIVLVDVREPWEVAIAALPGAVHVPLGELGRRLAEVDPRAEQVVVYCHHGIRSLEARDVLAAAGFTKAYSLRGGIDAWSREVDGSVPRY